MVLTLFKNGLHLLPIAPKSKKRWWLGLRPRPPHSDGERLCACQSGTPGGAPIPIFAPGARNPRYATDADDAEELENVVLPLKAGKEEVQVEGQGDDDVDDVDRSPEESSLGRADQESNRQLEGESGVA